MTLKLFVVWLYVCSRSIFKRAKREDSQSYCSIGLDSRLLRLLWIDSRSGFKLHTTAKHMLRPTINCRIYSNGSYHQVYVIHNGN